jgi:hypothetical protein
VADQNRAVKTQTDKKTGSKPEQVQDVRPSGESALAEDQAGPVDASGGGSIDDQTARLGSPHLQNAQRQALAVQIGQAQGNIHLQRLIEPLIKEEPAAGSRPEL